MKCVIGGSFYQFEDEIFSIKKAFEKKGVEVLSPTIKIKYLHRSVLLPHETIISDQVSNLILPYRLDMINIADFFYVVNRKKYVGPATSAEIGYAIGKKKRVCFLEFPNDTLGELSNYFCNEDIFDPRRI